MKLGRLSTGAKTARGRRRRATLARRDDISRVEGCVHQSAGSVAITEVFAV